ncbi:MAG: SBBP repeat-containing protein, partial [Flavobacteriales bacterium]
MKNITRNLLASLAALFCLNINIHAQTYQWAFNIGPGGSDIAQSIAVDGSGNVYVAGNFGGTADFDPGAGTANFTSAGSFDIFFAKYSSSGALIWAKTIGGSAQEGCYRIIVDAAGDVYIAGFYNGTVDFDPNAGIVNLSGSGQEDGFFAKYTPAGNIVWAKKLGGTNNDFARSIAVDNTGVVYVTGHFQGTVDFDPGAGVQNLISAGGADVFIGKYDVNGNYIWAVRIGQSSYDLGHDIVIDGSGNCYVSGIFYGNVDFDPGPGTANLSSLGPSDDIFLAAYSTTGT